MKRLLLICLFIPTILSAQKIKTSVSQINFGNVFVGTKDSVQLTITNSTSSTVNVNGIKFYDFYNYFPFSASNSSFSLTAGASQNIWIYFEPEQNINHNSELVIQHNANTGVEAVDIIGQGKFTNTYYNSTENLSEEALKTALKTKLAQGYSQLSYSAARDAMFMNIDNQKNNGQGAGVNTLECVYTGTLKTGYTSRSNAQSTNPNFNTEHTFPQGHFNQNLPMRSDIHHLFPTTNTSNSQRGNFAFGTVSGSGSWSQGGSKKSGSIFEPRDAQKGFTARAMMYFVIRYQDYSSHFAVQETILRNWHNTFPVNQVEERRNNDIFTVQNNRNPFIDYPQLEKRITNFVSNSQATPQFGLDILQSQINFGNVLHNTKDTFDYVLVNRGNQGINFSNISLSSSNNLALLGTSGSNATLMPGEAWVFTIELDIQQASNINETLNLSTNIPGGLSNLNIPIVANGIVSIKEQDLESRISLYPNPSSELITVENTKNNTPYNIYDLNGKLVKSGVISNSTINVKSLSKGMYNLELKVGEQTVSKKVVKQ